MAPTELAAVRRYEAAGFRAWPAASVQYDGTWAIRLTAGHPSRRLNSVNPLDPGDVHRLPQRIARAGRRFEAYGRPLNFRLSPLAGAAIGAHLDESGWETLDESLVMQMPLEGPAVEGAMDQIPLKDVGRFVNAAIKADVLDPAHRAGLSEIIGAIRPTAGLFVLERGEEPVTTALCVQDGELAGLFSVGTQPALRGKGHARRTLLSALKWARSQGARVAWLQVEAVNTGARRLYESLGFSEIYRYHYRSPPERPGEAPGNPERG